MKSLATNRVSPWPHRLAVALCCATFPLVWVGGLVTTHDAGMAVPDWPNTYGYNLFLYPWSEWFRGPWQLFIEHAHRLFAAAVGGICIAFVVVVWRTERRRWMRYAALAALGLVIAQGILGGTRVILDERTLAMIHGCVGPLFFAYCVLLATVTSQRWHHSVMRRQGTAAGVAPIAAMASAATLLSYIQLVLGAQLRHIGAAALPPTFRAFVLAHLLGALTLLTLTVCLAIWIHKRAPREGWLRVPANWLLALVLVQIALGGGAWVVNYGWPAWFADYRWAASFVVNAKANLQANITTAHVAAGSLILGTSAMLSLRACRLTFGNRWQAAEPLARAGAPA